MNELWALPFDMAEQVLAELALAKTKPQALVEGFPERKARGYELVGGVAVIPVTGPIVREQGWYGVGQDAVASSLKAALADPSARAILFDITSPGGVVAGTKELADAIAEARTKKRCAAYANGLCASAAYWLASATGTVYAPLTATVGSIGVIMTITNYAKLEEKWGISTVTITGGKLMTYRLMAEWTTDLICKKLNLTAKCTTAEEKLPGSREPEEEVNRRLISVPVAQRASSIHRHGDMAGKVAAGDAARRSLVCECEEVSVGEVEYALNELDVNNLVDLRRRTRVGMGTCQGELCACRAAGLMAEAGKYCVRRAKEDLTAFLNERWKGMAPVAWGDTLRESEFTMWLYDGVCGLTSANNTK